MTFQWEPFLEWPNELSAFQNLSVKNVIFIWKFYFYLKNLKKKRQNIKNGGCQS